MLKVSDVMTRNIVCTKPESTILEAARLMKNEGISALIVLEENKTVGIITEQDIVYKIVAGKKNPEKITVSEVMSTPVKTITANNSLEEAARVMRDNGIKKLGVVEGKKVTGIVTEYDLIIAEPALHLLLSK
jgi:CBS domain-containing protein